MARLGACGHPGEPLFGGHTVLAAPRLTPLENSIIVQTWGRRAPWAGCLALLLGACTGSHRAPPPSTDIEETGFRDAIRALASDDFEGRKPGTRGEEKTVAFLTAKFRKLGLKPTNGDSYVQQVPLVEILAGDDAALSVGGRGAALALHYGTDMVIWTKRVVPTAQLDQSDLVFVGYGIVAPEYHWNDYAGANVRGKTVLVLVSDPGYGSKDPAVFRGTTATYYGRWAYKFEEAARQGAAGVLLIHDSAATGYGWNVVASSWTGPQFDLQKNDDNAGRAAIEGWVTNETGRALFTRAGLNFDSLTATAARPGFKAVSMGLKVDAALHNSIRRLIPPMSLRCCRAGIAGMNSFCTALIGIIWAAIPAAQIFNGAVDNATGVAGLLMLAQSFSRTLPRPDRSIVFAAFTAEEGGLLGSAYYVEHPVFQLRQTAAVLNLDGLHVGGRTRDVMVLGAGNSELEDYVRAAALLRGSRSSPGTPPRTRSLLSFRSVQFRRAWRAGPIVKAGSMTRRAALCGARRSSTITWRTATTNRATNTRQDWDVRGAVEDLTLYYSVGERLANTRRFPRWYPNSEFSSSSGRGRETSDED